MSEKADDPVAERLRELIAREKQGLSTGSRTRGHARRVLLPRIDQLQEMMSIGLSIKGMVELLDEAGIQVNYHSLRSFLMKHTPEEYRKFCASNARAPVRPAPDEAFSKEAMYYAEQYRDEIIEALEKMTCTVKTGLIVDGLYCFDHHIMENCAMPCWQFTDDQGVHYFPEGWWYGWRLFNITIPAYSCFRIGEFCYGEGEDVPDIDTETVLRLHHKLGKDQLYVFREGDLREAVSDAERIMHKINGYLRR